MKKKPPVLPNQSGPCADAPRCRWRLTVRGIVQGVGFRPFVYNTAQALGLAGWVKNTSGQVEILIEGSRHDLECFVHALREKHPAQARIDALEVAEQPAGPTPLEPFQILASGQEEAVRPIIPADLAICADCRAEIHTPSQRRYRYPFTNCTHCGPRWSIIRDLPYDRPRTSMAHFAMCPECRAEYENPADRRFHAQPIACPRCGPKLRLLVRTSPADRCPAAWPETSPEYVPAAEGENPLQQGAKLGKGISWTVLAEGENALQQAAQAIREGRIIALKGLGGFQLLCDATQEEVVQELRRRKQRPDKPFALMFGHLDQVRQVCQVSEAEAALLQSAEAPIVLLRRLGPESFDQPAQPAGIGPLGQRPSEPMLEPGGGQQAQTEASGWAVASAVAPGNPYLGVMLPYTPLHELLMEAVGRPIVCTSGNLSEEPMAYRTAEAIDRLGRIADLILTHNRPIVRPVDDSVVRVLPLPTDPFAQAAGQQGLGRGEQKVFGGEGGSSAGSDVPLVQVLRRARGYAPRPIELGFDMPTILALGGHLKNTVGLSVSTQVVLSQHVGDLDNLPSLETFRRTVEDLLRFFRAEPERLVCDLHPDYASTQYAEQWADRLGVPLVRVQHHEAHLAACLAEQSLPPQGLAEPILGFSWDGTGYGWDGTIWGGEVLLWQAGRVLRVGSLWPFLLPGGDQAVRQPRRSALAVLYELLGEQAWERFPPLKQWFSPSEQKGLRSMLHQKANCPRASSMGRLFDAVAALCGLGERISFEGQAAMALEFAALEGSPPSQKPAPQEAKNPAQPPAEPKVEPEYLTDSPPPTAKDTTAPRWACPAEPEAEPGSPPDPEPEAEPDKLIEVGSAYPLPWIEVAGKSQLPNKTGPTSAEAAAGEERFGLLDWRPMVEAVLADRAAGVPVAQISRRFHAALADGILQAARWAANRWGLRRIALSGGCFQNGLLTRLVYHRLRQAGFTVYLHRQVPPGDGGIALGQILLAALSSQAGHTK